MSESLADTLTFEESVQGATWADTCFENQLLYLLEINALAGLLTDISKDWNLFVRLCGTMTTLQKFSSKSSFRTLLSWPLNVSIITKEYCSFGIHFSSLSFPLWWCCDVLKHCLNVCVLGTFVFYCTTPLHCCDYVRVISLHTLRVFLIKSVKIQYFHSDLVTFTEKIFNGKLHLCPVFFAENFNSF